MIKKGQKAPDFSLKDQTGKKYSLKTLKGDYRVIYFYPKDDTPGCTIQAKGYTKALSAFKKLKTDVVGISGGDELTKKSFCKKHGLKVLLLSDPNFKTAKKWGAYGTKTFMGKKFQGIFRNTYLLDKNGKLIETFEKVDPENDPAELLKFIQRLSKGEKSVALGKPVRRVTAKRTISTRKRSPATKIVAKVATKPKKTARSKGAGTQGSKARAKLLAAKRTVKRGGKRTAR